MDKAEWFKRVGEDILGPYDLETMRGFARAGLIGRKTEVSIGERPTGWIAAGETEIYREPTPKAPAPAPPPASPPAPVPTASSGPNWGRIAAILVVAGCSIWIWRMLSEPEFSDADIKTTENDIRAKYGERPGVKVEDVTLIRREARTLTGFVRLDVNGIKITQSCKAEMGNSGGNYIWSCRP